jgi:hypothetical protein
MNKKYLFAGLVLMAYVGYVVAAGTIWTDHHHLNVNVSMNVTDDFLLTGHYNMYPKAGESWNYLTGAGEFRLLTPRPYNLKFLDNYATEYFTSNETYMILKPKSYVQVTPQLILGGDLKVNSNILSDNNILIKPDGETDDYLTISNPNDRVMFDIVGGAYLDIDNGVNISAGELRVQSSGSDKFLRFRETGGNVLIQVQGDNTLWITENFNPDQDNTYDSGSANYAWKDVYYEGSAIDTNPNAIEKEMKRENTKALNYRLVRDDETLDVSKMADAIAKEDDEGNVYYDVGEGGVIALLQVSELVDELCTLNGELLGTGKTIAFSFCDGKQHKTHTWEKETFTKDNLGGGTQDNEVLIV